MHWITCVPHMQIGYIKSNVTLNYFMNTNFDNNNNNIDLFTKLLSLAIFDKCVKDIGMRRLKYL
jgi:hypothetical protein